MGDPDRPTRLLLLVLAIPASLGAIAFFSLTLGNPYNDLQRGMTALMTLLCVTAATIFWAGYAVTRSKDEETTEPEGSSHLELVGSRDEDLPYR